ncbi:MAG TPA: hypothetical protein V6C96_03815 [Vampirovibrionales bacterium]
MLSKTRKFELDQHFWKIKTKVEAHYIMEQSSFMIISIGLMLTFFGIILRTVSVVQEVNEWYQLYFVGVIWEGVLCLIIGTLLWVFKSKLMSIVFLLISLIFFVAICYQVLVVGVTDKNWLIYLVAFYYAIACNYAAFKYNSFKD